MSKDVDGENLANMGTTPLDPSADPIPVKTDPITDKPTSSEPVAELVGVVSKKTTSEDSLASAESIKTALEPLTQTGSLKTGRDSVRSEIVEEWKKVSAESAELHTAKRKSSTRRKGSKHKVTVLTFQAIEDRPLCARVQLLLCNISDRALHFKLKCNTGSNVSALPSGSAHVAPHGQVRMILNWTRLSCYETWKEVPPPKMLLVTRFLDGEGNVNGAPAHATSTRLVARVSTKKTCNAHEPPVEQLLLDAVGRSDLPASPNPNQLLTAKELLEKSMKQSRELDTTSFFDNLARFLNNLSDRGIFILFCILVAIILILKL